MSCLAFKKRNPSDEVKGQTPYKHEHHLCQQVVSGDEAPVQSQSHDQTTWEMLLLHHKQLVRPFYFCPTTVMGRWRRLVFKVCHTSFAGLCDVASMQLKVRSVVVHVLDFDNQRYVRLCQGPI